MRTLNPRVKNLFILCENALIVHGLRHFLEERYGNRIKIRVFYDVKSCMKEIGRETHLLVLDHSVEGTTSGELEKKFRKIHPILNIAVYSSREEVASRVSLLFDMRRHRNLIFGRPAAGNFIYIR